MLALALPGYAAAAGFDCGKASAPIEQAICGDDALSLADFVLTERYRHLAAQCGGNTAQTQRQWLAETRTAFTPGPAGLDDLRNRYQQRNDQLLRELDTCSLQRPIKPLRITTVGATGTAVKLPWVEAPSPEVARRINDTVFTRFVDLTAAPATPRDAAAALVPREGERRAFGEVEFTVRRNDGRLLVLEFSVEGCGSYCENYTEQMAFDARNGKLLENAALFTEAGLQALTRHFNGTRAARGRALIAHAIRERSQEADALSLYRGCIRDWTGEFRSMPVPELDATGAWILRGGHCSPHAARPWDLLDHLDVPLPRALLQAHLNAYGRSLLLAQGDVRDPAPPPVQCQRSAPLPAPPTAPIRAFAIGVEHQLGLLADGRLLAWGANNDGQLGRAEERNDFSPQQPIAVPGNFAHVAAGHGWSAAIDTEGRLWTWGSNYAGSLGDGGTARQTRPVQIGSGYVQLRAEERWGLALQRDGSLWTWGGRIARRDPATGNETHVTRPWKLGDGFAQIELGPRGELQALTRDGELVDLARQPPHARPRGHPSQAGHRLHAAGRPPDAGRLQGRRQPVGLGRDPGRDGRHPRRGQTTAAMGRHRVRAGGLRPGRRRGRPQGRRQPVAHAPPRQRHPARTRRLRLPAHRPGGQHLGAPPEAGAGRGAARRRPPARMAFRRCTRRTDRDGPLGPRLRLAATRDGRRPMGQPRARAAAGRPRGSPLAAAPIR